MIDTALRKYEDMSHHSQLLIPLFYSLQILNICNRSHVGFDDKIFSRFLTFYNLINLKSEQESKPQDTFAFSCGQSIWLQLPG